MCGCAEGHKGRERGKAGQRRWSWGISGRQGKSAGDAGTTAEGVGAGRRSRGGGDLLRDEWAELGGEGEEELATSTGEGI